GFVGVPFSEIQQHLFINRVAGSQRNESQIFFRQIFAYVREEVRSLLTSQAGYNSDQRPAHSSLCVETEFPQQRLFADALAGKVSGGEMSGDVWVRLRIPKRVVVSIKDLGEDSAAASKQPVEPPSIFVCLDFGRVGFADGADRVAVDDSGLH